MVKVKAREVRSHSEEELLNQVKDLKTELATLRVAQVTGGAAAKLARINLVRKNIARVLTVLNQNQKEAARKECANKKHKPIDQRAKKTRALRRALTPAQKSKTTLKEKTRNDNFPLRRYAVTA